MVSEIQKAIIKEIKEDPIKTIAYSLFLILGIVCFVACFVIILRCGC